MDLLRDILPSIHIRLPGWKLRRWLRSFWRSVIELLAIIGLGALAAGAVYYMIFIR